LKYAFLISAPDISEWPISRPGRFTPGTHWTERWAGWAQELGCVGP